MEKIVKIAIPIIVFLIGAAAFVILRATAPATMPRPIVEKQWPVKVGKIRIRDIRPNISEFGTIVAGNKVELRPLVSGRIIRVGESYKRGALVKNGEVLVVIDPFDYKLMVDDSQATLGEILSQIRGTKEEIEAEFRLLDISKSQLKLRERDLTRRQKLRKKGSSSRKSAEDAEIAFNEASQVVALREQSIARLKSKLAEQKGRELRARSSLKLAKRNLSETELIAPFDGFMSNTSASVGQYVTSNDQLATLIEASRLEVQFRLTKRDFSSLSNSTLKTSGNSKLFNELIGKEIRVKWRVGEESIEFSGVLARFGAEIEATSGGVKILARLKKLDVSTPLRPGAFVEVLVPDKLYTGVAEVPDTALVGGNALYVLENGYLAKKRVEVVRRIKNSVLVSGSFNEGASYVSQTFPEITSGLKAVSR